jgi:hypothetical protein
MRCAALNRPDGDPLPFLDRAPDVETDDPQKLCQHWFAPRPELSKNLA